MTSALPFTSVQGFLTGYLATGGTNGLVLNGMVAVAPGQIRFVTAAASGGGTTYILDVTVNGRTIWTNPADRPTLTGASAGKFVSGRVNASAIKPGDLILLMVAQAGNKANLVATVAIEDPSQQAGRFL